MVGGFLVIFDLDLAGVGQPLQTTHFS